MRLATWTPYLLLAMALATAPACQTGRADGPQLRPAEGFNTDAGRAFKQAEEVFDGGEFLEAIRRYNLIRSKFPYSEFAALSDLRIADAYFAQEKYATAVEQYRTFIKLYAEHPQVIYASWRVALSFSMQMPDDFFLLPPGYERDLARARDAERELRYFLRRHPDTQYTDAAKRRLLLARRRLADHELYVATFYLERDNPRAAAIRLTGLLKNYTGLGLDPQALFLLARAYLELKDTDRALIAIRDLIEVHPQSEYAAKARDYLKRYQLAMPQ